VKVGGTAGDAMYTTEYVISLALSRTLGCVYIREIRIGLTQYSRHLSITTEAIGLTQHSKEAQVFALSEH
jgi:hypothetical protein